MANLSAFADEVCESFVDQVGFLASEGVSWIEPRFVDGINIMDLSKGELVNMKMILRDNGIRVSAIGSPIGKVRLDEDFEAHLEMFKHAVDLAVFFDTRMIRIFSYYPAEGNNIDECGDEVIERFHRKMELIENIDVVLVHENEAGIYGHSAENCARLIEAVGSEKLRLAYDPANFVWGEKNVDNMGTCWPVMKEYVEHVHIKDWKLGADTGSVPGEGDGQIRELLAELAEMRYEGCLTMEPHLQVGGQFGGKTGPEKFSTAIAAVKSIGDEVGLRIK